MANSEFQEGRPPERPPRSPGQTRHQAPRRRAEDEDEDDDSASEPDDSLATLIPYRNPKALIAYYLGVFGLIPCLGALLGPAALILGILGLVYVRAHPTAKGTGHAITGIVLGSLALLFNWGGILLIALGALRGAFP